MTDQVPDFALPSRQQRTAGQARGFGDQRNGVAVLRVVARRAAPAAAAAIAAIALAAWAVTRALRSAQERRLRDFQSQLKSLSSMLDLDAAALGASTTTTSTRGTSNDDASTGTGTGRRSVGSGSSTSADMAKKILERGNKRYKFRTAEQDTEAEKIAAKVRLDLFQQQNNPPTTKQTTGAPEGASPASAVRPADSAVAPPTATAASTTIPSSSASVTPSTPYETLVADVLDQVDRGLKTAAAAGAALDAARSAATPPMSMDQAKLAFNTFVSRVVSGQVDEAAVVMEAAKEQARLQNPPTPELAAEAVAKFSVLANTMRLASEIAQSAGLVTGLAYVGAHAADKAVREDLYRSYAVYTLSDESRVRDDSALQGLVDMQMLLSLSDETSENINREIAKGMFQVAVSSAMADGSMTPESRKALEELKSSFGEFLDGNSADNIVSEVAVMRAMYSLQQLLQDQGVNEEDIVELRKMCADLGVDIDEMMRNADAMGDSLGPEVKQFVGGLRSLLNDGDKAAMADSIGNLMAKAAIETASTDAIDTPATKPRGSDPADLGPNIESG